VYGSMQLADYVVSYALQLNNRCLRLLAGAGEPLAERDLRELQLQVSRLSSLWELLRWSVGRAPYRDAVLRLGRMAELLDRVQGHGSGRAAIRGGEQLLRAGLANDSSPAARAGRDELQARLQPLWRRYPAVALPRLASEAADALSCDFQAESEVWRDYAVLRHVTDEEIVEHGFGRVFRKGARSVGRLLSATDTAAQPSAASPPLASRKALQRAARWTGHGVHHMELLKAGLSEASKARRWYLQRLRANLDRQLELALFCQTALEAAGDRAAVSGHQVLDDAVRQRWRRLQSQCGKLAAGAFGLRAEDYLRQTRGDIGNLGLKDIVLLPVRDRASAT